MDLGPILRAMSRNKVRFGLIAIEIALTLAIVTNCVSMIRDARKELSRSSGFDDENLISVRSTPFDPVLKGDGPQDQSVRQDLAALRTMPGVRAASNTRFLPWQGGGSSSEFRAAGSTGPYSRSQIYNTDDATTATLGNRIVEGKGFTQDEVDAETLRLRNLSPDRDKGEDGKPKEKFVQPILITQAYGRLVFPEGPLLGRQIEDNDGDLYTIVGVIDAFYNPYGWPIHEYGVFFPSWSRSYERGAGFLVRAEPGRKAAVLAQIEKKLLEVNPGRNLRITPLTDIKSNYQGTSTLMVKVLSTIIVLLVFVTSIGIVGLTSFSVAERTRQIGTRRALGAQKEDILRYFLVENWLVTTFGLSLGVFLAYGLNVALVANAGGKKLELSLVAFGVLLLWGAGLLSTLLPALRGSRVAPAIATRNV